MFYIIEHTTIMHKMFQHLNKLKNIITLGLILILSFVTGFLLRIKKALRHLRRFKPLLFDTMH